MQSWLDTLSNLATLVETNRARIVDSPQVSITLFESYDAERELLRLMEFCYPLLNKELAAVAFFGGM